MVKKKSTSRRRAEKEAAIARAKAWADKRRAQRLQKPKLQVQKVPEKETFHDCSSTHENIEKMRRIDILQQMLREEEEILFKTKLKIEMIQKKLREEMN